MPPNFFFLPSLFQDQANGELGRNESPGPGKSKLVGGKKSKKYRSRSTSASSQDSLSSGSYSGEEGGSRGNLGVPTWDHFQRFRQRVF